MSLGTKIRSFRIEKDKSPEQVADFIGVSESTYRRYESDKSKPDIEILQKLSELFEKPILSFLPEDCLQYNYGQEGGTAIAQQINILSDKLVEQYEIRLREKDEQIELLKELLNKHS